MYTQPRAPNPTPPPRAYKPSSSANDYLPVVSPVDGETIGKVCVSNAADVEEAVAHAQKAFPAWSALTVVRDP